MDFLNDDFQDPCIASAETGGLSMTTQLGNSDLTSHPHAMISDSNIIFRNGSKELPLSNILPPDIAYKLNEEACIEDLKHIAKSYGFCIVDILWYNCPNMYTHPQPCHTPSHSPSTPEHQYTTHHAQNDIYDDVDDVDMSDPIAVTRKKRD